MTWTGGESQYDDDLSWKVLSRNSRILKNDWTFCIEHLEDDPRVSLGIEGADSSLGNVPQSKLIGADVYIFSVVSAPVCETGNRTCCRLWMDEGFSPSRVNCCNNALELLVKRFEADAEIG